MPITLLELIDPQLAHILRKRLENEGIELHKNYEYFTFIENGEHKIARREIDGEEFEDVEVGGDADFKILVWSLINLINFLELGEILDCSS